MVNFYLGQQGGYTKYPCFLCYWDSRADKDHCVRKEWLSRHMLIPAEKNVINEPLVDQKNIILPLLHIKLGIMKLFIKALDRDGDCFQYIICLTFPRVSDVKKKAGIFDGPQIRTLLKDKHFMARMTAVKARAWLAFTTVIWCKVFLETRKTTTTKKLLMNFSLVYEDSGAE